MGRPSTRFWILFRYSGSLYKFFHLAIFLLPLESVNFFQFKTVCLSPGKEPAPLKNKSPQKEEKARYLAKKSLPLRILTKRMNRL